jgi:hypothetical protein
VVCVEKEFKGAGYIRNIIKTKLLLEVSMKNCYECKYEKELTRIGDEEKYFCRYLAHGNGAVFNDKGIVCDFSKLKEREVKNDKD